MVSQIGGKWAGRLQKLVYLIYDAVYALDSQDVPHILHTTKMY